MVDMANMNMLLSKSKRVCWYQVFNIEVVQATKVYYYPDWRFHNHCDGCNRSRCRIIWEKWELGQVNALTEVAARSLDMDTLGHTSLVNTPASTIRETTGSSFELRNLSCVQWVTFKNFHQPAKRGYYSVEGAFQISGCFKLPVATLYIV